MLPLSIQQNWGRYFARSMAMPNFFSCRRPQACTAGLFLRPGELRADEWAEFDLDAAEWRGPAARMKMGVDHIVTLAT